MYIAIRYDTSRHSLGYVLPLDYFCSRRPSIPSARLRRRTIVCHLPFNKADNKANSNTNATQHTKKPTPTRHAPTPLSWLSFRSLFWGEGASGGSASSPPAAAAAGDGSRFVNTRRRSIPASTGSGFRITVSPLHYPSSRIWCTSYDTAAAVAALELRARQVGVGWESCRHSQDDCYCYCCCFCGMPVYPRGPPTVGTTRTPLLICLISSTRTRLLAIGDFRKIMSDVLGMS